MSVLLFNLTYCIYTTSLRRRNWARMGTTWYISNIRWWNKLMDQRNKI